MIFDKIENIDNYSEIPVNIKEFIKTVDFHITIGRHEFDDENYVNIDEYYTKPAEECRLEAHKKYIDIQLLLNGVEELDYIDVDGLVVNEEYDKNRDVMFFTTPQKRLNSVILEKGNFVLLYPHEAHQPQKNYAQTPLKVKKAVIKIKV